MRSCKSSGCATKCCNPAAAEWREPLDTKKKSMTFRWLALSERFCRESAMPAPKPSYSPTDSVAANRLSRRRDARQFISRKQFEWRWDLVDKYLYNARLPPIYDISVCNRTKLVVYNAA